MKQCKLILGKAGFCTAKANHAVKGDFKSHIEFGALFGVIQHPELGYILFDTGYTSRFYESTTKFPNKIYAKLTKVQIRPEDEAISFLKRIGIEASEIKHIVISHFHGDHIAGLKDFGEAQFYCSKKAYDYVKSIPNFWSFSKGILKELIPLDFENRLNFIEDFAHKKTDSIFGVSYDLFHDDSLIVVDLPGHAAGQIGIQLKTIQNNYFLVADACWDIRAITENAYPHPIVRLFFHSWKDYQETLQKLKQFHKKYKLVQIVPTHCAKTTDKLISTSDLIHEL